MYDQGIRTPPWWGYITNNVQACGRLLQDKPQRQYHLKAMYHVMVHCNALVTRFMCDDLNVELLENRKLLSHKPCGTLHLFVRQTAFRINPNLKTFDFTIALPNILAINITLLHLSILNHHHAMLCPADKFMILNNDQSQRAANHNWTFCGLSEDLQPYISNSSSVTLRAIFHKSMKTRSLISQYQVLEKGKLQIFLIFQECFISRGQIHPQP